MTKTSPRMPNGARRRAILLSIRPEHAERIFQGVKRFELRKVLPRSRFERVFLYETGGVGIVGCFEVGRILRKKVKALWRAVGASATTQERFFEYFKSVETGFAIEVKNPIRFRTPISAKELSKEIGHLSPPQSFIALQPGDTLYSILEDAREDARRSQPTAVHLRRISDLNREKYRHLVMKHIRPNYDDIDETFAASTLEIHDLGHDPAGFFTTNKEVMEIRIADEKTVGFTTLTFKSGGCVKTGPTILFDRYQRKGYGLASRIAIEEYVRPMGARKIYCTCPQDAEPVVRYLLTAGMRIEAHLQRHYSAAHDEFVFGKLLIIDEPTLHTAPKLGNAPSRICDPAEFDRETLIKDFANLFAVTWSPVSESFARALIAQAVDVKSTEQSEKPKRLVCLRRGSHCEAAIALMPKRGGAVKGLLLRGTRHAPSLRGLLSAAAQLASGELGGRKLYFIHPLLDATALSILRSVDFQTEGLIRAPYRAGQDAVVLAKFL